MVMENYQLVQRGRIGVLIPSTNTGVEYDLHKFSLNGLTWHPSRFWIELSQWQSHGQKSGKDADAVFEQFLDLMRHEIPLAIRNILSSPIHHLMLGMSAETFWGGVDGSIEFEKKVREQMAEYGGANVGLTTGAGAVTEALRCFRVKRLAVITPYPPVGDDNVRRFFSELGFEVVAIKGLCRPSAQAIAETPISMVLDAVAEVDGPDVDAIVQTGTNLSTIDLFPTLEQSLGKPMIPINVATIWHALRQVGIKEPIFGHGRLLEEF